MSERVTFFEKCNFNISCWELNFPAATIGLARDLGITNLNEMPSNRSAAEHFFIRASCKQCLYRFTSTAIKNTAT